MTDLAQARSAETGRLNRTLQELEAQQEQRLSRIDVEMSRRGLQHSDARLQAIFEARLERLNQVIFQRIAIRKDMVRNFPELGSEAELNHLTEVIHADVANLRKECQKFSLIVPPEVFADLRARARDGIDGLKREMALPVNIKPKLPVFSLNIPHRVAERADVGPPVQGGGATPVTDGIVRSKNAAGIPAVVTLDAVSRKVSEVIKDLEGRSAKLADALRRLAAAINEASGLADERIVYLEQIQFLAEQAARMALLRRISIVKGIFVALHAGLSDIPSVAPALRVAGPLLASHFGLKPKGGLNPAGRGPEALVK